MATVLTDQSQVTIGFASEDRCLACFRKLHARGLEGELGLLEVVGSDEQRFAVRLLWPDGWTVQQLNDLITGIIAECAGED